MSYIPVALRRLVEQRAAERCEYCLIHRRDVFWSHEVDHIYAEKHGGETQETNLCFCCAICNRFKSSDLCSLDIETGEVVTLFHPRRHQWNERFQLNSAKLIPLTPAARVTIRLLHLNDEERIQERITLITAGHYP